jgi:hypothetical protein
MKRYPETVHYLQSQTVQAQTQAQTQVQVQTQAHTPPPSNSTSPPNHNDSTASESFNQILAADPDIDYTQSRFDVQWSPPPLSIASFTYPGDLSLNNVQSNTQNQLDPQLLDVYTPFQADTTMTDYHFISENIGFQVAGPSPLVPNSGNPPRTAQTTSEPPLVPPNQTNRSGSECIKASFEDWPCFQCNPSNAQPINPKIGSQYLQRLEETLNDQSIWNNVEVFDLNKQNHSGIGVEPVQGSLRDKLMVISQGFLNRAREIHRPSNDDTSINGHRTHSSASVTSYFILPPPPVLEVFLRIYALRVEQFLPYFPGGTINLTQIIASDDEKSSILLILLMIAYGAMGSASTDAQNLANGLLEICRISMFDIVEKNVQMTAHPIMLRCALLYLSAAAWNGNRWHMDVCDVSLTEILC